MPRLPFGLKSIKGLIACAGHEKKMYGESYSKNLVNYLCMHDIIMTRNQAEVLKFFIPFICICRSPEYSNEWKQFALNCVDAFRNFFYDTYLHHIDIKLEGLDEKFSTEIMVAFSLGNEDVFLMRMDMPHKGVPFFHLNLEESHCNGMNSTGFPIRYDGIEYRDIKDMLSDVEIDRFFYEYGERLWFRSGFVSLLNKSEISVQNKEYLMELFNNQSHKTWNIEGKMNGKELEEFFIEIKKYFSYLNFFDLTYSNCEKNIGDIYEKILNVRTYANIYRELNHYIAEHDMINIEPVNGIFWECFKDSGLLRGGYSFENVEKMDLSQLMYVLKKYCGI